LIIGLVALLCVALAGGVAAVMLSSGGKDDAPTVAAAEAATPTQTTSQVRTVVTVVRAASSAKKPAGSSSTSRPKPSNVGSVSRPRKATATATATSSVVSKSAISQVIRGHWANIEAGNYAAAFDALAPGAQSESSWISAHREDALTEASLSLGTPTLTSSTTATVPVLSLRTEAASGCNDWTGHYEMVKVGGAWKIDKAKISNTPC
jgi:hypothetical protein